MSVAPDIPGLTYLRPLGSGGYADVFLYQQQLPRRSVAVKVLRAAGLTDALRAQFTAEANAMAGLAGHPNIVPVFAADVAADGRPYIVMMFYPRPNLGVRAASERLPVAEVLRIGIQVASALETAHEAGILHRDVKPANILTSQFDVPGLTDFGIAGQIAQVDEDDEDAGVSVPWAPPEVLYSSAPTSRRSDVYSLAATLWNLLVGRSPFEVSTGDNSAYALMARIRDLPVPPVGRADVPEALDRLLRQAMAKDPAGRPATALEFARSLQSIEQAQQLPRTEIVVTVEAVDTPVELAPPGIDATRMRATPMIIAQTPLPASPAPTGPSPFQPTQPSSYQPAQPSSYQPTQPPPERPVSTPSYQPASPVQAQQAGAEATYRRPTVVVPEEPAHPGDGSAEKVAVPRPSRLPWLVGTAVVGVAVVVLAAFGAFSGGGGGQGKPLATVGPSTGTQDPIGPGAQTPPGIPAITATAAADHRVVFHWTYSSSLSQDSYLWRLSGASTEKSVSAPRLTLPDPSGARLCIQVKVVRADGSDGTLTWSPEGCGK